MIESASSLQLSSQEHPALLDLGMVRKKTSLLCLIETLHSLNVLESRIDGELSLAERSWGPVRSLIRLMSGLMKK